VNRIAGLSNRHRKLLRRFADANECPVAVEGLDVDILKAIALEKVGLYEGRTMVGRLSGIRTQIGRV